MFTIYTTYENAKFADIQRHVEAENKFLMDEPVSGRVENKIRPMHMLWQTLIASLTMFFSVILL